MDVVTRATRAQTHSTPTAFARPNIALARVDLQLVAQHMYTLMMRNVASDGFLLTDSSRTLLSHAGCVIAAPSYPSEAPGTSQDYVFHWVRDAAITAMEMAAASLADPAAPAQPLIDYVTFSRTCFDDAQPTKGHACFTVDGRSRPWSEQNDGPALQTLTILAAFRLLDSPTQAVATQLVGDNLNFLLGAYERPTTNIWEEHTGFSFFARSVQLKCFREVAANPHGIAVPDGVDKAIAFLESAIDRHWNGTTYLTLLGGETAPGSVEQLAVPPGYDPNIDVVQGCLYGAVAVDDPRLLATAAHLRATWAGPSSENRYPINVADAAIGLGPLFGRYPADTYDGDSGSLGRHPWPLCTANFAQLYYELAAHIEAGGAVPTDPICAEFFQQIGAGPADAPTSVVSALRDSGDAMMRAVIYHSDHLELSEQYDGNTGYEKSVRDLTWSYAAFLSAVRARNRRAVSA